MIETCSAQPPLMPRIAGSRRRLNGAVIGVTILVTVWLVHQTEYLIEYGRDFAAVMHTSPHRFYMAPAGVVLALVAVGLLSGAALWLQAAARRRRALERLLPERLAGLIPTSPPVVAPAAILRTALVLALIQGAAYVIQENLEMVAVGNGWPLLGVLFAPQHWTVVPLHLLAALCAALILWSITSLLRRADDALRAAQRLVRLTLDPRAGVLGAARDEQRLPQSYLPSGRSRAPPAPAFFRW